MSKVWDRIRALFSSTRSEQTPTQEAAVMALATEVLIASAGLEVETLIKVEETAKEMEEAGFGEAAAQLRSRLSQLLKARELGKAPGVDSVSAPPAELPPPPSKAAPLPLPPKRLGRPPKNPAPPTAEENGKHTSTLPENQ